MPSGQWNGIDRYLPATHYAAAKTANRHQSREEGDWEKSEEGGRALQHRFASCTKRQAGRREASKRLPNSSWHPSVARYKYESYLKRNDGALLGFRNCYGCDGNGMCWDGRGGIMHPLPSPPVSSTPLHFCKIDRRRHLNTKSHFLRRRRRRRAAAPPATPTRHNLSLG